VHSGGGDAGVEAEGLGGFVGGSEGNGLGVGGGWRDEGGGGDGLRSGACWMW